MCEPLRGKRKRRVIFRTNEPIHRFCYDGDDVKSAVEFYKKYRQSTDIIKKNYQVHDTYNVDLWYDHPNLVEEYLSQGKKKYNEWLFDYCFGDVIEG